MKSVTSVCVFIIIYSSFFTVCLTLSSLRKISQNGRYNATVITYMYNHVRFHHWIFMFRCSLKKKFSNSNVLAEMNMSNHFLRPLNNMKFFFFLFEYIETKEETAYTVSSLLILYKLFYH